MELTDRQREVYELRHRTKKPMTYVAIGAVLGISHESAKGAYRAAKQKLERPHQKKMDDRHPVSRRTEATDPDKAAAFIDRASDPAFKNLAKAARESGLPGATAVRLMDRIEGDYQPVAEEATRIKTDVLVRQFENVATKALHLLNTDPEKLDKMNGYQLALIAAIATDKRELLDGRPTERISVEDRRAMPEMLTALLKEAGRRGLMKEINPDSGRGSLAYRTDAPSQVRAGRERMAPIEVEAP